ncbi:MAG: HAMP domain-containing histidine kinase [Bacteroidales bacterium]|nr:HAMP domain-containing histidine kinase [Bacteroidales bacterium]
MSNATIYRLVILGLVAIFGIFGIQYYLLRLSYNESETRFTQQAQIALLEVVKRFYDYDSSKMPQNNPVKKVSNEYYVVDINKNIDCEELEFYLKSEFKKIGLSTDFEYAVYDCETDDMVYGNYIAFSGKFPDKISPSFLPKHGDLVYYFGVRFPRQKWFIATDLWLWIIFTIISFTFLVFFVSSIGAVLGQKRYSELQRDFINNMTHEFKTPISSNKLALDYLNENEIILTNERLKKYCETLLDQNKRLDNLVNKILNVSRTENKVLELHKSIFGINAALHEVVEMFQAHNKRLSIAHDKSIDSNIMIEADNFHFSNIIYNLIDNALKYSTDDVKVDAKLNNNFVSVIISDKGIGIEKKYEKKIFQRFYRVPTGNIHNVKGFGLGLFYVKRICDMHKWKINLKSELKAGTSVAIKIPIVNEN